jgi:hypothetical protein
LVPPSDEIHPDEGVLARILELAGTEMILVGGQARATFRRQRDLTLLTGQIEKELPDKQDEHGIAQLHLAIATVREFLSDIPAPENTSKEKPDRPATLRHLRTIETLALSDAGRKLAKRQNVYVADAIDPVPLLHIKSFATKKLPQLLRLMSAARRGELETVVE